MVFVQVTFGGTINRSVLISGLIFSLSLTTQREKDTFYSQN